MFWSDFDILDLKLMITAKYYMFVVMHHVLREHKFTMYSVATM